MEQSRLRKCAGMRLADLDPILEELAWEGRIRIEARKYDKFEIASPFQPELLRP
jgi:hypothetical protein